MRSPHPRDYRLLAYFVEIVDSGSIRGAARALDVSAPVVSTALSDLEALAGTTLLLRGARKVQLTDAGERLYGEARRMVETASAAMTIVGDEGEPTGAVAMTLPVELSLVWLPDRLTRFQAAYPHVTVTIHAVDEMIELADTDIDFAVRALPRYEGEPPDDIIASLPLCLVAAPSLLKGRNKHDLANVESVRQLPNVSFSPGIQHASMRAATPDGGAVELPFNVSFFVNNAFVARELAVAGFGTARILEMSGTAALDDGRLRKLLPDWDFGTIDLSIVYRDRLPSPAARAFAGYLQRDGEVGLH